MNGVSAPTKLLERTTVVFSGQVVIKLQSYANTEFAVQAFESGELI